MVGAHSPIPIVAAAMMFLAPSACLATSARPAHLLSFQQPASSTCSAPDGTDDSPRLPQYGGGLLVLLPGQCMQHLDSVVLSLMEQLSPPAVLGSELVFHSVSDSVATWGRSAHS